MSEPEATHLRDVMSPYPESMRVAPAKKSGPGSRYVRVAAEAMEKKLADMGFTRSTFGREIIFTLTHKKCRHTTIEVLTSIAVNGGDARGCGEDAIRVFTVYKKPWRGREFKKIFHESPRIYRTGTVEGVLERMYQRAREAYQAGTDALNDEKTTCFECCKGGSR